jgi:uncharacterized SAM-dependent methyltransferase
MHLESARTHAVAIDELALRLRFEAGETIRTESCAKYDQSRVERLLVAGGFGLVTTYADHDLGFAVHVAVALENGDGRHA